MIDEREWDDVPEHLVPDHLVEPLLTGEPIDRDAGEPVDVVALLLTRVRQPPTLAEHRDARAAMGAFVDALRFETRSDSRTRRRRATIRAAAVIAAATLWSTGAAAAATGNLPDGLQRTVAHAAAHVGISLPTPAGRQGVETSTTDDATRPTKGAPPTSVPSAAAASPSPSPMSPAALPPPTWSASAAELVTAADRSNPFESQAASAIEAAPPTTLVLPAVAPAPRATAAEQTIGADELATPEPPSTVTSAARSEPDAAPATSPPGNAYAYGTDGSTPGNGYGTTDDQIPSGNAYGHKDLRRNDDPAATGDANGHDK